MKKRVCFLIIISVLYNLNIVTAPKRIQSFDCAVGETELHKAALYGEREDIKRLLNQGFDINIQTVFQKTPLSYAVIGNNLNTTNALLDFGADINMQDIFHDACSLGYYKIVLALVNFCINEGFTVKKILNKQNSSLQTPLFCALISSRFNAKIIELLILRGADIQPFINSMEICIDYYCSLVRRIMHYSDEKQNTILHYAAQMGAINLVNFLLDYGAKPFVNNYKNKIPYDLACKHKHEEIARVLLWSRFDDPNFACVIL